MANTFFKIQTVAVGAGGISTIDFNSIPQIYTDLKIVLSGRSTEVSTQTPVGVYFNNDTTNANYPYRRLYGISATIGSDAGNISTGGYVNAANSTSSIFGVCEFYIPNYTVSRNKSVSSDGVGANNAGTVGVAITGIFWNNTAAITSLKLFLHGSASFTQHSTATLYGITSS